MIVTFYDENFRGLKNNASLVSDNKSLSLIRRPIEFDSFSCVCEPFDIDIQPTFVVYSDNRRRYVYGCFAGIPLVNTHNKTEISGTDLKSYLSNKIYFRPANSYASLKSYLISLFEVFKTDVNQGSFGIEFDLSKVEDTAFDENALLKPTCETGIYNVYEEMSKFFRMYNYYIESELDLINMKIVYTLKKLMSNQKQLNIRLWDYNVKNYGKYIASINESQGYYNGVPGIKWILTSKDEITTDETKRDIYPIKREVVESDTSFNDANEQSLTNLIDAMYNEDIDLYADNTLKNNAWLDTAFHIYNKSGEDRYKTLPCGELVYDENGLKSVKIGFRYTGIDFV